MLAQMVMRLPFVWFRGALGRGPPCGVLAAAL